MTHRSLIAAAFVAAVSAALLGCPDSAAPTKNSAEPDKSAAAAPPASAASSAPAQAADKPMPPMPKAAPLPALPEGLEEPKVPTDNPITAEKVELGKELFFDKRLSKDGSASCETCHHPDKGWTDGLPVSTKVGGAKNTRHSPTLFNVAYNEVYYWDGRSPTLEKQIEAAWKGQLGADPAAVAAAIAKVPGYAIQFKTIYGGEATPDTILKSLGSFVRTIRSGGSPWDKSEKGDKTAVSEDAKKGWEIFRNKAGCAGCHAPPQYTDNGFHDTGIGFDKPEPDEGRGKIAKDEKLNGAFKTPTLRSVTTHAPYFHDGRAATLDEAVDFMLAGGIKEKNPNLDAKLKPVKLSKKEREQLMAFLKALEAPAEKFEEPKLPE